MKSTSTLLAVLGLLAVAGTAHAQGNAPLATWTRSAAATESDGSSAPEFVVGYNFLHATNCVIAFDGTTTSVCLLPKEGCQICATNPVVQNGMLTACQTGNFLAFYFPNPAIGVVTQIVTFINK